MFAYDSAPNGWGRLGSVSTYEHFGDSSGATPIVESFEYTVAGLVSKKTLNVVGTSAVSVGYEWDSEGRPVAQKFPDMAVNDLGPRFTWGYDSMSRLATMGQTVPGSGWATEIVTSTEYNAAGQMTKLVRPGGTENRTYNVLGQLTKQDGLGRTVEYSYSATANDGRITKRKELSGEEVDYLYDSLGRLISAATTATTGWGLNFTYDGFGNKTGQTAKPGWTGSGTVPQPSFTVDAATNRLGGFGYDANGNVTSGLAGLAGTYSYDGENRLVNNGVETYGYGAGNRRLWKKATGSQWAEVYLYGLGGEVLEVFGGLMGSALARQSWTPTQRAWFGGRLIEKKGTAMNADRLGSYEKAYPYGELATAPGTSGEKFATYWRDAGTGLDYAVNRYYSSQMGRFLTADPYQASGGPGNPGSWNRYAYVEGDPVNRVDRRGLESECIGGYSGSNPYFCWESDPTKSVEPDKPTKSKEGGGGGATSLGVTGALRSRSKVALDAMSTECKDDLKKRGMGIDLLKQIAESVNYFDAQTRQGSLTIQQVNGSQWTMTLESYLGNNRAVTLPDTYNIPTPNVVIGASYWTQAASQYGLGLEATQNVTLVHELLHVFTKLGDLDLATKLGLNSTQANAAGAISTWLRITCF